MIKTFNKWTLNSIDDIKVIRGDITKQKVDVIVNAANNQLWPGGGVNGAIHYKAGINLQQETMKVGYCPTGEARLTKGYGLPSPWVIHTVGPKYPKNSKVNDKYHSRMLRDCYRSSFAIAKELDIKSIAFPCISMGAFGYPTSYLTVAFEESIEYLGNGENSKRTVCLVCYEDDKYKAYTDHYKKIREQYRRQLYAITKISEINHLYKYRDQLLGKIVEPIGNLVKVKNGGYHGRFRFVYPDKYPPEYMHLYFDSVELYKIKENI